MEKQILELKTKPYLVECIRSVGGFSGFATGGFDNDIYIESGRMYYAARLASGTIAIYDCRMLILFCTDSSSKNLFKILQPGQTCYWTDVIKQFNDLNSNVAEIKYK
jgi:hypothetical protein